MAKLDVKVIDMEDGVVTKVEHDGKEYVKVSGNAREGDVVKYADPIPNGDSGGFYKVYGNDAYYRDDDDLQLRVYGWDVFTKVTVFR